MTQFQAARHAGRNGSEAPMPALAHRLQRLETIGRTRGVNADDFRIGVFHGDEDIGPTFSESDRLRHVRSHISLTSSVTIVPSCALVSARPVRCGASKACSPISRRTRRRLVRIPATRSRAHLLR